MYLTKSTQIGNKKSWKILNIKKTDFVGKILSFHVRKSKIITNFFLAHEMFTKWKENFSFCLTYFFIC